MCTIPLLRTVCRESYNDPLTVYQKLKRLEMDPVTITDHDSIDPAEAHRSPPDFSAKGEVGGSDAHGIDSVGCTWTVVPSARSRQEYLDGLRRGMGKVRGATGGYWKLTRDILTVGEEMVRNMLLTIPLAPLALGVPMFTLGNYVVEAVFARLWLARYLGTRGGECTSVAEVAA